MTKWVYSFGGGTSEGETGMKNLLGGKGANLAEMANLGLPVPPGFTLTTEVCTTYYDHDKTYPNGLSDQVEAALRPLPAAVAIHDPVAPAHRCDRPPFALGAPVREGPEVVDASGG